MRLCSRVLSALGKHGGFVEGNAAVPAMGDPAPPHRLEVKFDPMPNTYYGANNYANAQVRIAPPPRHDGVTTKPPLDSDYIVYPNCLVFRVKPKQDRTTPSYGVFPSQSKRFRENLTRVMSNFFGMNNITTVPVVQDYNHLVEHYDVEVFGYSHGGQTAYQSVKADRDGDGPALMAAAVQGACTILCDGRYLEDAVPGDLLQVFLCDSGLRFSDGHRQWAPPVIAKWAPNPPGGADGLYTEHFYTRLEEAMRRDHSDVATAETVKELERKLEEAEANLRECLEGRVSPGAASKRLLEEARRERDRYRRERDAARADVSRHESAIPVHLARAAAAEEDASKKQATINKLSPNLEARTKLIKELYRIIFGVDIAPESRKGDWTKGKKNLKSAAEAVIKATGGGTLDESIDTSMLPDLISERAVAHVLGKLDGDKSRELAAIWNDNSRSFEAKRGALEAALSTRDVRETLSGDDIAEITSLIRSFKADDDIDTYRAEMQPVAQALKDRIEKFQRALNQAREATRVAEARSAAPVPDSKLEWLIASYLTHESDSEDEIKAVSKFFPALFPYLQHLDGPLTPNPINIGKMLEGGVEVFPLLVDMAFREDKTTLLFNRFTFLDGSYEVNRPKGGFPDTVPPLVLPTGVNHATFDFWASRNNPHNKQMLTMAQNAAVFGLLTHRALLNPESVFAIENTTAADGRVEFGGGPRLHSKLFEAYRGQLMYMFRFAGIYNNPFDENANIEDFELRVHADSNGLDTSNLLTTSLETLATDVWGNPNAFARYMNTGYDDATAKSVFTHGNWNYDGTMTMREGEWYVYRYKFAGMTNDGDAPVPFWADRLAFARVLLYAAAKKSECNLSFGAASYWDRRERAEEIDCNDGSLETTIRDGLMKVDSTIAGEDAEKVAKAISEIEANTDIMYNALADFLPDENDNVFEESTSAAVYTIDDPLSLCLLFKPTDEKAIPKGDDAAASGDTETNQNGIIMRSLSEFEAIGVETINSFVCKHTDDVLKTGDGTVRMPDPGQPWLGALRILRPRRDAVAIVNLNNYKLLSKIYKADAFTTIAESFIRNTTLAARVTEFRERHLAAHEHRELIDTERMAFATAKGATLEAMRAKHEINRLAHLASQVTSAHVEEAHKSGTDVLHVMLYKPTGKGFEHTTKTLHNEDAHVFATLIEKGVGRYKNTATIYLNPSLRALQHAQRWSLAATAYVAGGGYGGASAGYHSSASFFGDSGRKRALEV